MPKGEKSTSILKRFPILYAKRKKINQYFEKKRPL
jgi:hypothetical protein